VPVAGVAVEQVEMERRVVVVVEGTVGKEAATEVLDKNEVVVVVEMVVVVVEMVVVVGISHSSLK